MYFDLLNINVLDVHIYSFLEDIFVICMIYNFFKLLFLGLLCELTWPTQFFNRRNFIGTSNIHKRVYTEFLAKLYNNLGLYKFTLTLYIKLCL